MRYTTLRFASPEKLVETMKINRQIEKLEAKLKEMWGAPSRSMPIETRKKISRAMKRAWRGERDEQKAA